MAAHDAEIDRLFQLPPDQFTAARNALAKTAGSNAAAIKALEKPSVAAWAVNQLYWQQRRVFDALVAAARQRRAAHLKQLSGKRPDLDAAEAAHRDALRAATHAIRDLLARIGDPASPATMVGVTETLQTLPSDAPFGRLTRALKPLGFEALSGVVPAARKGSGESAESPSAFATSLAALAGGADTARATPGKGAKASKPSAKETAAAKRRVDALERQLREARDAEAEANSVVTATRRALVKAEHDRDAAAERLRAADEALAQRREDLSRDEKAATEAAAERQRLEDELGSL